MFFKRKIVKSIKKLSPTPDDMLLITINKNVSEDKISSFTDLLINSLKDIPNSGIIIIKEGVDIKTMSPSELKELGLQKL